MATNKIPLSVPAFSAREIILAELCAQDLWRGIDFQTGNNLSPNDEDLLITLSHPAYAITNAGAASLSIRPDDIKELVRVAKLGQFLRGGTPTDYQAGINNFPAKVIPVYSNWINPSHNTPNHKQATKAILDWSPTFTDINPLTQAQGKHRVVLCSRILFFALPELPFFNFSHSISRCLNLQLRAEYALPRFNSILENGYNLNWKNLANTIMPPSTRLHENIRLNALKSDWWGRRVLDIALLLHFRISHARLPLQNEMQKLAAIRGV
jgi:hypothetical protein